MHCPDDICARCSDGMYLFEDKTCRLECRLHSGEYDLVVEGSLQCKSKKKSFINCTNCSWSPVRPRNAADQRKEVSFLHSCRQSVIRGSLDITFTIINNLLALQIAVTPAVRSVPLTNANSAKARITCSIIGLAEVNAPFRPGISQP